MFFANWDLVQYFQPVCVKPKANKSAVGVNLDDAFVLTVCVASQSLRVDDDYRLVDDEDDPFASKFMSFEVLTFVTLSENYF